MKKVLVFLVLLTTLFATQAFAEICNSHSSVSVDSKRVIQTGSIDKCFVFVRNTSSATVEKGGVFILDVGTDDGYSVTTGVVRNNVPFCISTVQCVEEARCKCQRSGLITFIDFDSDNGEATAGELAFLSTANAGFIQSRSSELIKGMDVPIGIFYDSPSASAEVEVFLTIP